MKNVNMLNISEHQVVSNNTNVQLPVVVVQYKLVEDVKLVAIQKILNNIIRPKMVIHVLHHVQVELFIQLVVISNVLQKVQYHQFVLYQTKCIRMLQLIQIIITVLHVKKDKCYNG